MSPLPGSSETAMAHTAAADVDDDDDCVSPVSKHQPSRFGGSSRTASSSTTPRNRLWRDSGHRSSARKTTSTAADTSMFLKKQPQASTRKDRHSGSDNFSSDCSETSRTSTASTTAETQLSEVLYGGGNSTTTTPTTTTARTTSRDDNSASPLSSPSTASSSSFPTTAVAAAAVHSSHDTCVAEETLRSTTVNATLDRHTQHRSSLTVLLEAAIRDTTAVHKATAGLALAQSRLAASLFMTSPEEENDNDDEEEDVLSRVPVHGNDPNDDDDLDADSLPERKVRDPADSDEEDNETTDVAIRGTHYAKDDGADARAPAMTDTQQQQQQVKGRLGLRRRGRTAPTAHQHHAPSASPFHDGSRPPVAFVTIPNEEASDAVSYVVAKQHDAMQQAIGRSATLLSSTTNNNTKSSTKSINASDWRAVAVQHLETLNGQAKELLDSLHEKEAAVKAAWDVYFMLAEASLASLPRSGDDPESSSSSNLDLTETPASTLSDTWLAQLAYRQAVQAQANTWKDDCDTLTCLWAMVQEGERERRVAVRRLVVASLHAPAQAFGRMANTHADAMVAASAWVGREEEDKEGVPPAANAEETKDNHGTAPEETTAENASTNEKETEKKLSPSKGKLERKRRSAKKEEKKLTTQERMQQVANYCGTTMLPPNGSLDAIPSHPADSSKTKDNGSDAMLSTGSVEWAVPVPPPPRPDDPPTPAVSSTAVDMDAMEDAMARGIDVDALSILNESSDDDKDLPLLANAKNLNALPKSARVALSQRKQIKKRVPRATKQKKKKSKTLKTFKKTVNNVVILDQHSPKQAYFMDRLLYSGSLLESHYVQYSAVAGLDQAQGLAAKKVLTSSKGSSLVQRAPTTLGAALVVVTSDEELHIFELPVNTEAGGSMIVPGSPPDDALRFLLKQNITNDLKGKATQEDSAVPTGSHGPSARNLFTIAKDKENTKDFQFGNLTPAASIRLDDFVIRLTKRGDNAVKLCSKDAEPTFDATKYGKLNFATAVDQQNLMEACRDRLLSSI